MSDYLDQVNKDRRIHTTSGQHQPLGLSPGLDKEEGSLLSGIHHSPFSDH